MEALLQAIAVHYIATLVFLLFVVGVIGQVVWLVVRTLKGQPDLKED